MSDEDLLSPAERELEAALRSLRPSAACLELAPPWGRVRRVAVAAAIVAAATGALLWLSPRQKSENRVARQSPQLATESSDAGAVLIQASVDPPTLLTYRQALGRSMAELETLLDRQEASSASSSRQFAPTVLTLWMTDPHSPLGEM